MQTYSIPKLLVAAAMASLVGCGGGGGGDSSPAPTAVPTPVPAPVLTVTPASIAVGAIGYGVLSGSSKITVSNTGNAALILGDITRSGTYFGDFFLSGNCAIGATLLPAETCEVNFSINPSGSNTGAQTADINIASNGGNKTVNVTYSPAAPPAPTPTPTPDPTPTPTPTPDPTPTPTPGPTPTPAPVVSVAPASIDIGKVALNNTSGFSPITVTNTGTAPLTISGISYPKTTAEDIFQGGTCQSGSIVAPQANCTINIAIKPLAAASTPTTFNVTIKSDGGADQIVPLTYVTVTGAAILVIDAPVSFAAITTLSLNNPDGSLKSPNSFYLKNIGGGTNADGTVGMKVNSVVIAGTDFTQTNDCTTALIPSGGTCKIDVSLATALAGSKTGVVTIDTNAWNGNPRTVGLIATVP